MPERASPLYDCNFDIFFDESWYRLGLDRKTFQMVMVSMLVVFVVSIFQEKGYCIREKLEEQDLVFRWMIYLAGVLAVFFFGVYGLGYDASGFQYMQF